MWNVIRPRSIPRQRRFWLRPERTSQGDKFLMEQRTPGLANRTFGNQTQSNPNRLVDFDWFGNISNLIELTPKFCQSNH